MSRTVIFIAVLAFALGLTGYACWHLWRIAPHGWKLVVAGLFMLWAVTFFLEFPYLERFPLKAATVMYNVGNTWLIAFMYLLILFFLADIATLCHLLPKTLLKDNAAALLAVLGAVTLILAGGGIHYHHKYREEMTIRTDKPLEKPLTIVMASDLHLGYHNRRPELARWVDLINAEDPDLVLFGGDIIDRSLRPLTEGGYAEEFRRLKAPAMAVLGNHEYISGVEASESFYREAGIRLLKDSAAHFKGIEIIGRNDLSNPCRAALWEISAHPEGYTIVLDHQPSSLGDAREAGADFQFSGHTHHGQVWPISWVTDLLFEKAWGHLQKGDTQYYISSGLGIWGAKVRVGTRSEYLVLHLTN